MAYLDESKRPQRDRATGQPLLEQRYAIGSTVVMRADSASLRAALIHLSERRGVDRLRYADLGPTARATLAIELAELHEWEAAATVTDRAVRLRHDSNVRRAVLAAHLQLLVDRFGVEAVVAESRSRRSDSLRRLDGEDVDLVRTMRGSGVLIRDFAFTHEGKSEPLLWLADFVASSLSDSVCGANSIPWNLIGHRVTVDSVSPRFR